MKNKKAYKIVGGAITIALLVLVQALSGPLGQLVTGSAVNLILLVGCMTFGLWPGSVAAILSPFFAFMLGRGPAMIQFVPMIAIGNLVYVIIYYFGLKYIKMNKGALRPLPYIISGAAAAAVKFLVLSIGAKYVLMPLMTIPEKMVAALGKMFGVTQLFTALIGALLALVIIPIIKKAMTKSQ